MEQCFTLATILFPEGWGYCSALRATAALSAPLDGEAARKKTLLLDQNGSTFLCRSSSTDWPVRCSACS